MADLSAMSDYMECILNLTSKRACALYENDRKAFLKYCVDGLMTEIRNISRGEPTLWIDDENRPFADCAFDLENILHFDDGWMELSFADQDRTIFLWECVYRALSEIDELGECARVHVASARLGKRFQVFVPA